MNIKCLCPYTVGFIAGGAVVIKGIMKNSVNKILNKNHYRYLIFLFLSITLLSTNNSIFSSVVNKNTDLGINGYKKGLGFIYNLPVGKAYYLSPSGNDTSGDGSSGRPWRTLKKVRSVMASGDTIYLRGNNTTSYGQFSETEDASRTNWITFKADRGHNPVIDKLNLDYRSLANAYLRFEGIKFSITTDTNRRTFEVGINIRDARNVEIRNCEIYRGNYASGKFISVSKEKYLLDNGIRLNNAHNVLIYKNHLHTMIAGIVAVNSNNCTIYGNHIHELAEGCGIIYDANSSNFVIELNNIYDSNENTKDKYYSKPIHSASIEIKSSNVIVRKNIFHGIGSTAGLIIQEPNTPNLSIARSNIIIENNIVYDPHNTTFIIQNLGKNVIIRNNTFIGRGRNTANPAMRLYVAFSVRSIAKGYDGSGLYVYNNIVAGVAIIPATAHIRNNIFWSFFHYGEDWKYRSMLDGNIIVTSAIKGKIPDYFTNGFFKGINSLNDFDQRHNLYKDFTLASTSGAINKGSADKQPVDSLGSTTGTNGIGYVQDNGVSRSSSRHSIGCFEH